jgi:hypothetical protein
MLSQRKSCPTDTQEVGLEAAILERKRNSSLVEGGGAENPTRISIMPKTGTLVPCTRKFQLSSITLQKDSVFIELFAIWFLGFSRAVREGGRGAFHVSEFYSALQ